MAVGCRDGGTLGKAVVVSVRGARRDEHRLIATNNVNKQPKDIARNSYLGLSGVLCVGELQTGAVSESGAWLEAVPSRLPVAGRVERDCPEGET